MRMVGNSMVSAPRARSRSDSSLAWARARVTTTRLPKRGRSSSRSNQRSASRRATTPPTTVTAGEASPASATAAAMVASVPVTVRCWGRVPHCVVATGVSAGSPPAWSASTMRGRVRTPIRKTSVARRARRASAS